MIRRIYFEGKMKKEFNTEYVDLAGDTIFLLCRGLRHLFGQKIEKYIKDHNWIITRKSDTMTTDTGSEEVHFKLGNVKELYFEPTLEFSSDVARIIVGVVIMVVGYFMGANPYVIQFGAAVALGGVAGMLTKKPQANSQRNETDTNASWYFSGVQNVSTPGVPVPLIYGRCARASTVVISVGVTSENF